MNNFTAFRMFLCTLFAGFALSAAAQGQTVAGIVSGTDGQPLPGVTVIEKGTTNGVSTAADGSYSLRLQKSPAVLVFSYIGYESAERSVPAGLTQLSVTLNNAEIAMDDVVVVGYGTVKRSTLTSSVASVKSDEFVQGAVTSPLQLLQGRVAGLAVNTTSGDPNNSGVQVMLRGVSTLTGSQEPLIVIDGISGGSLSNISVDDIESIDILKDGSAAAIYGTRGTNGVILITTKKGAEAGDKFSVDYHGYASVETISNQIDVFSADEYRNLGKTTNGFFTPTDKGVSTDWSDEVFRAAFSHTHHLALKSGNAKSNYYASVDYRSRDGIIRNTGQERTNLKFGFNRSLFNDKMTLSANINDVFTVGHTVSTDEVLFATLVTNPTEPIYGPTGDYSIFVDSTNPVKLINEYNNTTRWNEIQASGKVTYTPIEPLTFTMIGGYRYFGNIDGSYASRKFDTNYKGQAWRQSSMNQTKTLELYGQYAERWNKHDFSVLAGYSYNDYLTDGFNMYNYDFPTDILGENIIGTGMALKDGFATMGGFKNMSRLISFFGRANYGYDDRYLFSASLRYEGSSKFGANHKWGLFYAASGAWRISKEKFMKDVRWVDELKLRVGYGVTGSEPSSPYLSHLKYAFGSPVLIDGKYVYTIAPHMNANPDLKWEEKHELSAGLDFALFNYRLSGSVDFYNRTTDGLLYEYNVPVPPNLASTTLANVGKVSNTGVEVMLNGGIVRTKHVRFDMTGNFSYNTNKMKRLSNEMYQRDFLELGSTGAPVQKSTHIVREGGRIGDFYGWKSIGMNENGSWIVEGGEYGDNASRQVIGNGIPTMHAALTANLQVKNFDLSVTLRGSFDFQILNQYRMLWENFARGADHNFPRSILRNKYNHYVATAPAYVSYYVEDGDFVKIDNITLGYTFRFKNPKNPIRTLRLYASGLNLYTFTRYQGVDPEINFNGLTPGVDYVAGYPTTRTFTFGVKLGF